jgi:hyperosmotically inducible protein
MKALIKYVFMIAAFFAMAGTAANAQSFVGGKRPAGMRAVEDKIFHEILMLPNYGLFDHITYQMDGNTVILGGDVYSLGTRKGAENRVKRIPGVQRVVNNIRELPPSPSDDRIRRELVRQIARTGGLYRYLQGPNPSVRLIVDNGRVSLEGYVSNRSDANLMNIAANGIFGVFNVQNNLIVTREQPR